MDVGRFRSTLFSVFTVWVLVLSSALVDSANYQLTTVTNCESITVKIGQDGKPKPGRVVFGSLQNANQHPFNCSSTVHLVTPVSYQVGITFETIAVDCKRNAYVEVGGNRSSVSFCGSWTDRPFSSAGNYLYVSYFHGDSLPSDEAITLFYTAFHYGQCGIVDKNEFACSNNRCVNADVKCDDYDNCADESDEEEHMCGNYDNDDDDDWKIPVIVVCSVVGGVVVIIVSIILCVKFNKEKMRTAAENSTSDGTVVTTSSNACADKMNPPPPYSYVDDKPPPDYTKNMQGALPC